MTTPPQTRALLPNRVARDALELVENMLVVTDRDGHILFVNEAFTRVTGYSAEEAMGATPAVLRSGVQDDAFYEELWHTILAGQTWDGELVNRRRDGTLYTDRMTITPLLDASDRITNFVAVKRDVSSHLAELTAGSPLGAAHVDVSGRLVYANHHLEGLLGAPFESLLGTQWLDHVQAGDVARLLAAVGDAGASGVDVVLTLTLVDGVILRGHLAPLRAGGAAAGVVATFEDVTAEAEAEAELRAREQYARAILNSLDSPTAVVDGQGVVTAVNAAWTERADALGGGGDDLGPGVDYLAVCSRSADAGCEPAERLVDLLPAVLEGHADVAHVEYACPEEATFWEVRITPLRTRGGGAVLVHSDITARRQLELVLRERVVTDSLTGLRNRAGFLDLARRAAARTSRSGEEFTVLFIDLDGFKGVNDTHGHEAGDEVLVACARRITTAVRDTDVVARFGGDEFVVLGEGIDPTHVRTIAARIEAAVAAPISLDAGGVVTVGASVGAARGAADDDLEEIIGRADAAMYRAKAAGR